MYFFDEKFGGLVKMAYLCSVSPSYISMLIGVYADIILSPGLQWLGRSRNSGLFLFGIGAIDLLFAKAHDLSFQYPCSAIEAV